MPIFCLLCWQNWMLQSEVGGICATCHAWKAFSSWSPREKRTLEVIATANPKSRLASPSFSNRWRYCSWSSFPLPIEIIPDWSPCRAKHPSSIEWQGFSRSGLITCSMISQLQDTRSQVESILLAPAKLKPKFYWGQNSDTTNSLKYRSRWSLCKAWGNAF